MVELIANDSNIDLGKASKEIKYTIQKADIFDLAKVSNSYTNSFSVDKSPINTQTFEGLAIVGDVSNAPYDKINAVLRYYGLDVIRNGWLNITETSDKYKLSIIDGMIDFFKAIENKTLGTDLDLTNFKHEKTPTNIVNSFNNEYYTYLFADYGGLNNLPLNKINLDFQVPSFSVKKLFYLIFSTFGYTCNSQEMEDFITNLWITNPTPPTYVSTSDDLYATLFRGIYQTESPNYNAPWSTSVITNGSLINNFGFIVPESGAYNIFISNESYSYFFGGAIKRNLVSVLKNGIKILEFESDPFAEVSQEISIICNVGDIISYSIRKKSGGTNWLYIRSKSVNMRIYKINQGVVNLSKNLEKLKITDFFKELLNRTGLIPTLNPDSNSVSFIHISEKIDTSNYTDWSEKFVQRKKEIYIVGNYAQQNYFKMKYNDGEIENQDGIIKVINRNIAEEKTLFQSIIYAPNSGVSFIDNLEVPRLQMYQSEVKEQAGVLEVEYKNLDNRFYFVRKKNVTGTFTLKSIEIAFEQTVSNINIASIERTLLGELLFLNFSEYEKIFNKFKTHEIELSLSVNDILSLNFDNPYYFEQEKQFYILNKVTYQEGKLSIGEFVRINK